jgi:ATP-binding protein involved in chromosome partitioning
MDKAKILEALKPITGPNNQSIVDSGMVGDIEINDGDLHLSIQFPEGLDRDTRHAVEDVIYDTLVQLEGINDVEIDSEVPDMSTNKAASGSTNNEAGLSTYDSAGARQGSDTSSSANAPAQSTTSGSAQIKHIIAIGSGKGGVGKSTIAANLAISLSKAGAKVGLCDIDMYGPSAPIIFGVNGAKVKADDKLKKFIPIESYGVKIMSIGFLIDEETPVIWRGPIVGSIVKQFLDETHWEELDYLIIDLPPGTGDAQLTLTQSASITGAIMVTTPSELSVADAIKGMQMFRKVNIPILGVVENMSYYICGECGHESAPFNQGGTERMCVHFGTQILVRFPLDEPTQRGGDEGKPIVISQPESSLSQNFRELADQVIEKLPFKSNEKRGGLLSSLFKS